MKDENLKKKLIRVNGRTSLFYQRNQYEKPTPIQGQAIPAIMSGRDMIGKISSLLTAVSSLLFEKMSPKSGFLIEHRQFPPVKNENSLRTETYFRSSLLSTRKITTG